MRQHRFNDIAHKLLANLRQKDADSLEDAVGVPYGIGAGFNYDASARSIAARRFWHNLQ
jgi:hypothetical protein